MSRRLTRRGFLGAGLPAAFGLGAYFYGGEATGMARGAYEAWGAWQDASLSNDDFLAANRAVLGRVVLGCSFAPEQWNEGEQAGGRPSQALGFCVEDLGLREVRLPIRWDRVARPDGTVDLSVYRPYLDYCFRQGVNVCLNVGPLRTFRWPEDRAPPFVLAMLPGIPPHGATIGWGSPLADAALTYLDRLFDQMLAEYGDRITNLAAVQPENESFQGFDQRGWRVSSAYMANLIRALDRRLPKVPILVTSAGRPALGAITDLFAELLGESDRFKGRLISGFDYYYTTPRHDRIPLHRYLDPIALAFSFPSARTCEANIEDSRAVGFRIEVSEGQAEPYAQLRAPGNSARDFRFMLLRCARKVFDPEQDASVLRIWGVEELARKALGGQTTAEHEAIFDLIRRLAGRGAPVRGLRKHPA